MPRPSRIQIPVSPLRPPLRALATFEAAARLGSFNAAAHELRLTPSAISHQIMSLERLLGIELFARVGRGVELTTLGTRYFEKIQRILLALDETTREIVSVGALDVVTIHTPPSLASKWLLPLLPGFMRAHPQVEVRVSAETGRAGFGWDTIDLAILYRQPHDGESHAIPLLEELVQPMCSPATLKTRPIKAPADVLDHVLIHSNYNAITWRDWFGTQGLSGYGQHQRIQIDPSHVAIEAAVKDFGVVLESDVLAGEEIASGRLVAPLAAHAIRRTSYVLTWSPDRLLSPSARVFRDWLVATARERHHRT
jgi:LysR family glycine cleavage system transcriptional activator